MKSTFHESAMPDESPSLDISSLIDVCFLLLIYFLATSTILPSERDLDMSLPGERSDQPLSHVEPLWIRVLSNGEIFSGSPDALLAMDEDPASRQLPLLESHLDMMIAAHQASGVPTVLQLQVDEDCDHQRVIDVLNALAGREIGAVTIRDLLEDA